MGLLQIIGWCLFGLVVGLLARLILPGKQAMGWIMTMVLGIVGSFAGGALSQLIFGGSSTLVRPSGWIMSILGAIIVLLIYSQIVARKTD